MLPDALMPTFPAQTVLILCYNVLGFSKAYCYLWHMSILDMCWVEERCQLLLPATCYWLEHSKAAVFCLLIPSPFICPLFLPSLFSWFIVDEYQLWESKGRNILSSQRVVNVTSLLSILNFRINLFNCSFVYSLTHLFMMGTGHIWMSGATCRSLFSPSTVFILGTGQRLSGLVAKIFICWNAPLSLCSYL